MTAQAGERLIYDGHEVIMCTEPLGNYFALGGNDPGFMSDCTALWRGYIGTWEIINDRLYIVRLTGTLDDRTKATLKNVFPSHPNRVFAHWYSGTLRIPEGIRLKYIHMGYGSVYERNRFLKFEKGVVVSNHVRHHGDNKDLDKPKGIDIEVTAFFESYTQRLKDLKDPEEYIKVISDTILPPRDHLRKRWSIDEIETHEIINDPLGAVPLLPFGHLNPQWETFKQSIQDGDQLWSFSAPWSSDWGLIKEVRDGYVVLRGEATGPHFTTHRLSLDKDSEQGDN